MALVTRCPNCATAFRVTAQHLQVHGGDVRCGHCAHVFNGFATLCTVQEPEVDDLSKILGARTYVLPAPGLSDQTVLPPCLPREITTGDVALASGPTVTEEPAAEVSDTASAMLEHSPY